MYRSSGKQQGKTDHRARGERGQALIIAVLVMLILGALAGLFIVVVSWGLAQSATEAERIGAQYLAEAGIRFANDQLTYGAEGADWRPGGQPDEWDEWVEYPYGDGTFRLRITYQPKPDDPLSKFIKIEAEGRRSAARYRLVAYKPIFITDYLRFVTNSDKSARRAEFGEGFFVYTTDENGDRANMGPYKSFWHGSIQINGDLEWYGPNHMVLLRGEAKTLEVCPHSEVAQLDDRVQVSRYISQNPDWQSGVAGKPPLTVSVNGAAPEPVGVTFLPPPKETTVDPNFETVEGAYRDGVVAQTGAGGFSRAASYYEAPVIDLGSQGTAGHRYHALTRDSGEWRGSGEARYNAGWYGYGDGIYIDNFRDKEESSYEAWRQKWAEAAASGSYPDPPGAIIWLHPRDTDDDSFPDLTIQRDDKDWVWRDKNSGQIDPSRYMGPAVTLPYPKNGVIYAEGNIRIGGVLPQSPPQFKVYPDAPYPGYWNNEHNRRYDLTVVSGGTIYIEGALTNASRDFFGDYESERTASKIALLALDNVCLDATRSLRPVGTAPRDPEGGALVMAGQTYGVEFSTAGIADTSNLEVFLRHAGTQYGSGYWTQMQLLVDGKPYEWGGPGGDTTYYLYPTAPFADNSAPVISPYWEAIPCDEPGLSDTKRIQIGQYLDSGPVHRVEFTVSGLAYQLLSLTIQPLTVSVDALIYAQRGSWYVLGGPWFEDLDDSIEGGLYPQITVDYGGPGQPGFPRPDEPSDISLLINGAISENRTAPIGDVVTWTQRWRGADEWWLASGTGMGTDAPAAHGLQYRYDPYLRLNVGEDVNRPRLPRLPVSPVLISAEETRGL